MISDIEVKDSISDVISCYPEMFAHLEQVSTLFHTIEDQLENPLWKGLAKEKSKCIHLAIKSYYAAIHPLCLYAQSHIQDLKDDAESFSADSSNVKMIKSW